VSGEQFGSPLSRLGFRNAQSGRSDPGQLLRFENVYISTIKRLEHISRETEDPKVMIHEARYGGSAGGLALQNGPQGRTDLQQ
jgi:hypothetical protein